MDSKLTGAPAGGAATGPLADTDVSDISGDTVNPPPEKASAHAAAIAAKADAAAAGKSPEAQDAAAAAAAARANPRKMIPSLRALADEDRATAKKARASWQMFTIMAEFIEATEYLSEIRPAVSIYGSARLREDSPYYQKTIEIARLFSDAGFAVISGGGPGIM